VPTQAEDHAPPRSDAKRRLTPGEQLPLRVGFVGEHGLRMLGGSVEAVALRARSDARGLAALVVDDDAGGLAPAQLERLADQVRRSGGVIICLTEGPEAPAWADHVLGGPRSDLLAAPPVDPLAYNPIGFRDLDAAGYGAVLSRRDGPGREVAEGLAVLGTLAGREPVVLLAPDDVTLTALPARVRRVDLDDSPEGVLGRVRARLGVIDHPSFHASEWERAGWIVRLCAAGVPVVVAEPSPGLRDLLGAELFDLLVGVSPRQLADLDARERLSVALRRVALREHSVTARWRQICAAAQIALPPRPMVSVIFATRREEWLAHGLAQVERQTYEPRELVVCLHGDDFAPDVEERIGAAASGAVKVVRVDSELTLGDALNAGVEASEGELVTKMDDDDYYNVDHLWDLALACEYSGADLVGKGAEFVYLGGSFDLTIRRFMGDGESAHPRLAGGALMARREPLAQLGGWPRRNRGEDTWIVKNFRAAGRPVYRTHGFGYILNRHFRGHTWNTYVDYFLVQSQREWRGLRFDETAIEP
jgi:hypothetical protein